MDERPNVIVEAIPHVPMSQVAADGPNTHADLITVQPYTSYHEELYGKDEASMDYPWNGEAALLDEEADASHDVLDNGLQQAMGFVNGLQTEAHQDMANADDERLIIVEVPEAKENSYLFQSEESAPAPASDGRVMCEVCDKTFHKMYYLRIHMRTHHGIKPYTCDVCGKTFTRTSLLTEHKCVHNGKLRYPCNVCGKRYRWNSSLRLHLQTHSDEKQHVCTICNRAFRWRIALRRHMTEHAEESPYKCEICKKTFSDAYCLTQHARVHTGERPFSCPDCGRTFRWKHQITQHACSMRFEGAATPEKKPAPSSLPAASQETPPSRVSATSRSRRTPAKSTPPPAVSVSAAVVAPAPAQQQSSKQASPVQLTAALNSSDQRYAAAVDVLLDRASRQSSAGTSHGGRVSSEAVQQIGTSCSDPQIAMVDKRRRATGGCPQDTPMLVSIGDASGSTFTARLANFSSESMGENLHLVADIVAARGHVTGEPLLNPTSAQGQVSVDSNGQRKLLLTLPKSALLSLLHQHIFSASTNPATSLSSAPAVNSSGAAGASVVPPAVAAALATATAAAAAQARNMPVSRPGLAQSGFQLQNMPTPDVTLGAPLML